MTPGDWTYVALGINPVGGLLVAVPWGVLEREYPWFVLLLSGPLLAYTQVLIVDFGWHQLNRLSLWQRLVSRRNARIDKLLQSGGAFLPVFLVTPVFGPWFVMAVMRYAEVPQRRVAVPILLSLLTWTALLTAACVFIPGWFR